jgi:hypothetical protein
LDPIVVVPDKSKHVDQQTLKVQGNPEVNIVCASIGCIVVYTCRPLYWSSLSLESNASTIILAYIGRMYQQEGCLGIYCWPLIAIWYRRLCLELESLRWACTVSFGVVAAEKSEWHCLFTSSHSRR